MTKRVGAAWLLMGALVALVSCRGETPVPTVAEDLRFLDADGVTFGGNFTFTNEEGIRTGRLSFDTAYHWDDSVNTALRGVDLTVYHEDGSQRAHLTSLRGLMDERWERLTAQGNVILVIPGEDRRLESQELNYDPAAGRIWSDSAFVMIHGGGPPFRGSSFTSNLEFTNFQATGPGG